MERQALKPEDAERRESVLVFQVAEFALDSGAATVEGRASGAQGTFTRQLLLGESLDTDRAV